MKQYLESQIAERKAKIAEFERNILTAKAELSAFEDALTHLEEGSHVSADTNGDAEETPRKPTSSSFQMSEHWLEILRRMDRLGHSFGAVEISETAAAVGKVTTIPNVRAQMAYYKRRKVIRRTAKGRYMLTDAGRQMLRDSAENASDKHPASPASGGNESDRSIRVVK